jgi:UDP-N-acetyl-D-mannosaminuronic acid transferase (WecB/TagA/CpsF family)
MVNGKKDFSRSFEVTKMKENILGYDVNNFPVDACADRIFQSLRESKRTWMACFNPHSYAVALKDNVFARALKDADWLVLDGTGIVLAIKQFSWSSAEIQATRIVSSQNDR